MSRNIIIGAVIGAIVLSGASFFAGTKVAAGDRANMRGGDFAGMQPGSFGGRGMGEGAGPGGQRMGGQAGGGFTAGEIISKDERSITVSLPEGGSRIIFITESTPVQKSAAGTLADLAVGTQVVVTGSANQDGSISAQSVQIGGTPMRPGF